MIYETKEDLLLKAKEAEGLTFGDIDKSGRVENVNSKGHLGQIIEESFFGYKINSKSEADFLELGVELKVTPVRRNKNGTISAKERLVLNIINYIEEANKAFETSSFWTKNNSILMMFYQWEPQVSRSDYAILKSYLHEFSEEDLEVIRKDWEVITEKIRSGRAHELSEADTNYLAASTKGATKNSLRPQPYSETMAMQRAFSLKQSYMTTLIRRVIDNKELTSFTNKNELKEKTIEQLINERFKPFVGQSLEEISINNSITINPKSKSFLQVFVSTLLGIKGTKLSDIEEFSKANIEFKTVRLEPNCLPREHMSFRNVDFNKWVVEEWETSWLRTYFEETKFLFVVFKFHETKKENPNRKLYFHGIKLWNMPLPQIESNLKNFWFDVRNILNEGVTIKRKPWGTQYRYSNNLPGPATNGVCHLRPKARNRQDQVQLPDGQMLTKQAFWFDRAYVKSILNS